MHTVALICPKGGVGKTTLSLAIAVQAELEGKTVGVIDADPNPIASAWAQRRKDQHGKDTPIVAAAPDAQRLQDAVQAAREDGLDWLIIDTPAGVSDIQAMAAHLADLILMPCVPSVFNMDGLASGVSAAKKAKKPAFFVINRGRSKGINDECLVGLTSAYGLPAINIHISDRKSAMDSEAKGQSLVENISKEPAVAKSKAEFTALWTWLNKQMDKQNPEENGQ